MRLKILRYLKAALVLGFVGGIIYLIAWSHVFVVKSIAIHGTSTPESIMQILQENIPPVHVGEPLARVDVNLINREMSGVDWISRARISRSWLHGTLSIDVTPREPIAQYVDSDGLPHYFDAEGVVFSHSESQGELPMVNLGNQTPALKSSFAALITHLTPELLSQATSFKARSTQDLEMTLGKGTNLVTIKWGDKNYLDLKLKVLRKLLTLASDSGVSGNTIVGSSSSATSGAATVKNGAKRTVLYDVSTPLAPITKSK